MYSEPSGEKPCWKCKYRNYDSFFDESWCDHKPPPKYLPKNLEIDKWGTCEYWKIDD